MNPDYVLRDFGLPGRYELEMRRSRYGSGQSSLPELLQLMEKETNPVDLKEQLHDLAGLFFDSMVENEDEKPNFDRIGQEKYSVWVDKREKKKRIIIYEML